MVPPAVPGDPLASPGVARQSPRRGGRRALPSPRRRDPPGPGLPPGKAIWKGGLPARQDGGVEDPRTVTEKEPRTDTRLAPPWNVVVHDDPINLMSYVTLVFMRVFGYPRPKAERLMLEVHHTGRSVVWTGDREQAELYAVKLLAAHLRTTLHRADA